MMGEFVKHEKNRHKPVTVLIIAISIFPYSIANT